MKVLSTIKKEFDVAIIGSGTGGYPGAIYLAQKGLKVAVIEENLTGGECTNYGCVPSKAIYQFAESIRTLKNISANSSYEWEKLIEWADNSVKGVRNGIESLFDSYDNIAYFKGKGVLKAKNKISIIEENNSEIDAKNVILATGTDPSKIPVADFDKKGIISNREVFSLKEKPNSMLIVGGGVIGVELANMFSSLGIQTYLVELKERILPFLDKDVSQAIKGYLVEKGVKVMERTSLKGVSKVSENYQVLLSNDEKLEVDKVIISTGRSPKTKNIGLENLGIKIDERGFIKVNEKLETNASGIYATGDVVGGPLLAHKAIIESISAAKWISENNGFHVDYYSIPQVIFSGLEIAWIGMGENELNSKGINYEKIKLPIYYLAAVRIRNERRSFIKLLLDKESKKIYGIEIVAPHASEVISSYLPLYLNKITIEEASKITYPHLTVSESIRDIAEYLLGEPIHMIKK
ncbi:dihydrolipoyl dehydrogenase [Fervidicoccus fontis]|uniref:Dihydrolipoyl dehydrogenase n=1 Tax=Fervidicoccus fontis (strain DSM 19380 / JCM 18336 / VKM B-2539 / Kam940) TaxID=1163730 RepID=I0A1L9_FERFK|nr:dihydrolipoamide dehydrogenase [Fervidicoccus fontis Kam940]